MFRSKFASFSIFIAGISLVHAPFAHAKDKQIGAVTVQEKIDCSATWGRVWVVIKSSEIGGLERSAFQKLALEQAEAGKTFWNDLLTKELGSNKKFLKRKKKSNFVKDLKGMPDAVINSFTEGMVDDCKGLQRIVEEELGVELTYPNAKSAAEILAEREK